MSVASCTSSSSGSRPSSPEDDDFIYVSAQIAKINSITDASDAETLFSSTRGMQRPDQIAFTYFIWSERRKLVLSSPDMSVGDLSRNLSDRWKTMDYRERFPYFLEYQKFKKESVQQSSFKSRKQLSVRQPVSPSTTVVNFKKPDLPYSRKVKERGALVFKAHSSEVNVSASVAAALGLTERKLQPCLPQFSMPMEISKVTVTAGTTFIPKIEHTVQKTDQSFIISDEFDAPETYFSSAKEALDSYYMALCEPAFPCFGEEPIIGYDANFCYEAFMKISHANL